MAGRDRGTREFLSRRGGRFPRLLGCFAAAFFSLALGWTPSIDALAREGSIVCKAGPGSPANAALGTPSLQRAELVEDQNVRTYRTAPADPGVADLNEEERQKEEKAWIMLQNMDLYPRERRRRPYPPVNQPSHKPSVN